MTALADPYPCSCGIDEGCKIGEHPDSKNGVCLCCGYYV